MGRSSARIRSSGGSVLMSEAALTQSSQQQRLEAEWATVAPRVRRSAAAASGSDELEGERSDAARGKRSVSHVSEKRKRTRPSAVGRRAGKSSRTSRASGPVTPPDSAPVDETSAKENAPASDGAAAAIDTADTAAAAGDTKAGKGAQASQPHSQPSVPQAGMHEIRADEDLEGVSIPTSSQSSTDEAVVERAARASWTVPANPADAQTSSQSTNGEPDGEAEDDANPEDGDSSYDEAEHEDMEEDGELEHGVDFEPGELAELADTSERSQRLNAEFDRSRPRLQVGLHSAAQSARRAVKGQLKLCLGGSADPRGSGDAPEQDGAPTNDTTVTVPEKRETSSREQKVHPFFSRAAGKPGTGAADQQTTGGQPSQSGSTDSESLAPTVRAEDAGQHWSAFWQARVGSHPGSKAAAAVLRQGGQGARRRMSAAAAASSSGSRFAQCPCCGRSVAVSMLDEHLDRCGVAAASPARDNGDPSEHQTQQQPMGAARTGSGASRDALQPQRMAQSQEAAASTTSSGMMMSRVQSTSDVAKPAGDNDAMYAQCPICTKRLAVAYMNMHLDLECSGEIEDESSCSDDVMAAAARSSSHASSSAAASGATAMRRDDASDSWASVAKEWSSRWDALGRCAFI
eukprot:COSAG02_NODE_1088_length_14670_cov_237.088326_14_plen_632_part_00